MVVRWKWMGLGGSLLLGGLTALALTAPVGAAQPTFLSQLGTPSKVASTVPPNGDVNPYGVAVVSQSVGNLVAGDVLVSNFNAKSNVQGTGTTITQVAPSGTSTVFSDITALAAGSSCPGGIGLTSALNILPGGWVVVGSLPTSKGNLPKGDPVGCLIVLNPTGQVSETISDPEIDGPWDMTATSSGATATLYVSNALSGNTKIVKGVPVAGQCTVTRVDLALSATAPPAVTSATFIGEDFPWKANKAALVLAPTSLAISPVGTLFVDNSLNNTISAIPNAPTRTTAVVAKRTVISHGGSLNAPLGMTLALNGDLLVVNGNNGVITEVTQSGQQVAKRTLIKNGAGDLFGLALTPTLSGIYFVDDGANTLELASTPQT
ncbi:MAG TPA: hypothetical protein VGG38_16835 [Acidimicrobiales bacterium]